MPTGNSGTKASGQPFPTTRWTVIKNASDPTSTDYRESLEFLATTYWRPVYAHFRRKWGKPHDEASDLTQDFFSALCEKDFLSHVSQEHGRFRSYVMAALDNFVRLDYRARMRQKRGGGAPHFSFKLGEGFEPDSGESPEKVFLKEWGRSVLSEALEELEEDFRAQNRQQDFQLFSSRDVTPPSGAETSYEELARRFSVSVGDVTNILYRARKKLRELVLKRVRHTVTSDAEAEAEMKELFEDRGPR